MQHKPEACATFIGFRSDSGIVYRAVPGWRSLAAAGGGGFLDCFFDRFTGFASALLNTAQKFLLPAFDVLKIVIGERGPLLLQFAFGDVPVAFDFEGVHNNF